MAGSFVRLDFLDSLRCVAIFYVIVSHLALIPQPNLMIPDWMSAFIINGGNAGVSLFFVLSAFSLSYAMDARANEYRLNRNFYIRRFFRIAPLFYLMILIYWIRDAAVFGIMHPVYEILINASLLFNLAPAHITGFVWASWTIGVIALLYLIFPLIHKFVRTLIAAAAFFVLSVFVALMWTYFIMHYGETIGYVNADNMNFVLGFGFLQQLPVFACGIVTYRLFSGYLGKMNQRRKNIYGMILMVSFVSFYAILLTGYFQTIFWGINILHGICFSLLVLGLGLKPFRLLVNPKTVYPGKASYSMYLFHPIFIFTFIPLYYRCYGNLPTETLGYLASLLITLVPLTVISLISYRYIERPGIALAEKLIKKKWPV